MTLLALLDLVERLCDAADYLSADDADGEYALRVAAAVVRRNIALELDWPTDWG